jgi:hypothetical protein
MITALGLVGTITLLLVLLFVGLTIGFGVSKINSLAFAGLALLLGAIVWLSDLLLSPFLAKVPFFLQFVSLLQRVSQTSTANAELAAILLSVGILEIGLLGGYGAARTRSDYKVIEMEFPSPAPPQKPVPVVPKRTVVRQQPQQLAPRQRERASPFQTGTPMSSLSPESPSPPPIQDPTRSAVTRPILMPPLAAARVERSSDMAFLNSPLSPDERTVAELFLFGGIREVVPIVDKTRQGGYYYDELSSRGWNTSRQEVALDSLSRRGYLNPVPREKVLHCRDCGSANLEFRSECPNCNSVRLAREKVIEHFACGMVEKESAFKRASGDLICPKCNKKLELIGSDYRSLGWMYMCQDCGALNAEAMPKLRCSNCGLALSPEQENEIYLFAFSLNQDLLPKLREAVRPVEKIVRLFQRQGYTVFAPAFVRGKSGTQQTFDLLVLGTPFDTPRSSAGEQAHEGELTQPRNTVVDILTSDNQVSQQDLNRVYLKIIDVNQIGVVFAIPRLSESAKAFANSHDVRFFEGESIDIAIQQSQRLLVSRVGPQAQEQTALSPATFPANASSATARPPSPTA